MEPGRAKLTAFAALDHTGLNLLVFLAVGLSVATAWGEDVADPISLSPLWPSETPAARAVC